MGEIEGGYGKPAYQKNALKNVRKKDKEVLFFICHGVNEGTCENISDVKSSTKCSMFCKNLCRE